MNVFHSKPVETVATPQTGADPVEQPVPLSELERDLSAPGVGWAAHLSDRGVQVCLMILAAQRLLAGMPGCCLPKAVRLRR